MAKKNMVDANYSPQQDKVNDLLIIILEIKI